MYSSTPASFLQFPSKPFPLCRHLLPENALSRVFFPSKDELVEFFSPSALPQGKAQRPCSSSKMVEYAIDYGGSLPKLSLLEDPMSPRLPEAEIEVTSAPSPPPISTPVPRTTSWLSPTSLLNPFFGYPVSPPSNRGLPYLRYGRRRKRDLVRTLLTLFWIRWHKHVIIGGCLTVLLMLWKLRFARLRLRLQLPRRDFLSSFFVSL